MTTVLFGGAVLTSFLAGVVALFAPCCISVMLPAYFASSFATKRALVAMTLVFAVGIGFVILPIALGAAAIGAFVNTHHLLVYLAGGLLMVFLGAFMIAGGKLSLPMPGMPVREGRGPLAVLSLGAFSGLASSCCAPVLAGVATLAGASGSLSAASTLGVAYVFGMIFPLFLIALLWDRFDWASSRLLKGRTFQISLGARSLKLHTTALASGLILSAMGAAVIVIAFRGNSMPSSGWQVELSARLQHWAHVLGEWLRTAPAWVSGLALAAALASLIWIALRQTVLPPSPRSRRFRRGRTGAPRAATVQRQEEST